MAPAFSSRGWSPPATMDEYRMVRLIGRGGMGQIFLAEDTLLERPVAVKFIASVRPDESARQRFHVEARALARLSHPNVVAVHRVGEIDGRPYLVAEFVRGRTLDELPKPLPSERALRIGMGLARGLAAAHRQGVLHRDIKPANVMVTEDEQVKLLDFGLAKLLGEQASPASEVGEAMDPGRPASSDALSGADGVLGTPLYMAPESLRGEPATRRSDIYSLGAVLYELCTGIAPRQTVRGELSFEEWTEAEPTPLSQLARELEPRLAAIISRCLLREPERRFASADELCGALDELGPERAASAIPEGNPYRGLRPFEAEHRALFFGRSAEIRTLVERLRTESLLVVAGDSGVGKSSLCRAGVLPLVAEEGLGDRRRYRVQALVPGRQPLSALVAAASAALELDEQSASELLRGTSEREPRKAQEQGSGALVFIDQLEEVFTLGLPGEGAAFAEGLVRLAALPGVRVLMAIRGDFIARLAALPSLGEELSRALYLLRPLSPEATRAAITGPARQKGFHFESEATVDALAESSARAAGGLPLLQFAMAELWEARDEARHLIPASALEAVGGVAGALARHADGVLEGLLPEQRRVARSILLRLVTAQGTRARLSGVELGSDNPLPRGVLDALVRGRLLVASEVEGETAYEVSHEALLQDWGTLRRWLDTDGERRQVRERLELAAAEWVRLKKVREALWSERQLAEAGRLERDELSPQGVEFLLASRTKIRRARQVRLALLVLLPLVVGLALGAIRLKAQWDLGREIASREQKADGDLREGLDRKREALELRRRAHELFDKPGKDRQEAAGHRREAERVWERALKAVEQAEVKLALAGRELEAALALDPSDLRIRQRVGDVLAARIELAEWFHHRERYQALAQWLVFLVPDRQSWLHASPHLSIETSPPGAEVILERYAEGQEAAGRTSVDVLGETPLQNIPVSRGPGSYRLVLKAPGRAPVRYPLLLQRAEAVDLRLEMPREEAVPEGFVYVPPGRFLLGSAEPEGRRRGMLRAPPLHEASTGAFLISRMEVTFRDWLQFLEELPQAERDRLTPFARLRDWGLELKRFRDGVWSLTLTLNKVPRTVREGEPLMLPARSHRVVQDWSRLPVSAISFEDAQQYFEWLDRTGRVPGARFCTELEWERAARGADGRVFPHGELIEPEDANFDETYGRQPQAFGPDEVGSHPASVSPFGLHDMVGNVYELTRSMWDPHEVVIRGGSWYYDSLSAMAANRTMLEPKTRDMGTGLRVCADAPLRE